MAAGMDANPLTGNRDLVIVTAIVWADNHHKNRPLPLGGFAAVTLRFIPQPRRADSIYIAKLSELHGSVQQLVSPAPRLAPRIIPAGSRLGGGGYEPIRSAPTN